MSRTDFDALVCFAQSLAPVKVRGQDLPRLWFFTDRARIGDPAAVARRLPPGSGVVLRDYGAPNRDALAREMAAVAADGGLIFVVGEDADLARTVGAAGVHLPERSLARLKSIRAGWPKALLTTSAHSREALLQARRVGADAAFVSPIFSTASHPGASALGADKLKTLLDRAPLPVIALGGIAGKTVGALTGLPLAGIAAIGALSP
jgi:thiamine-phosphate pyrophosphorylase